MRHFIRRMRGIERSESSNQKSLGVVAKQSILIVESGQLVKQFPDHYMETA